MSQEILRVATVQFELRNEATLIEYLDHVHSVVEKAAHGGANAVLLPELASTGLLGSIRTHEVTASSISSDYWKELPPHLAAITEHAQGLAQEFNLTIIAGSHNRVDSEGVLRNSAIIVSPDGRVEHQDKLHLTPQEHELGATGGDSLLVTSIGSWTIGVLICADIQYPELSRHLLQRGVEIIFCPSLTWNRRGVHRVKTGCEARAIENQMYVVMSPLIGNSGLPVDAPMYAVGKALVAVPVDKTFGINDGILAIAQSDAEEVIFADLKKSVLLASRETPEAPGIKLHRPKLYEKLAAELHA